MTNTILFTMQSILYLLSLITLIVVSFPVSAGNNGYCKNALTTADIIECISENLSAENEKMNNLFNKLKDQLSEELTAQLETTQRSWISYRDQACTLQGLMSEGGSLQRIQEIDCKAEMTKVRSNRLGILIESLDPNTIIEFSVLPRWVNVLREDYKDVYWQYADNQAFDTDCDGVKENVVSGLRKTKEGYRTILAIADSQATGRPKATIINFDDQKNCEISGHYMVTRLPSKKPVNDDKTCKQYIEIQTKKCGNFLLSQQDEVYSLQKKEK